MVETDTTVKTKLDFSTPPARDIKKSRRYQNSLSCFLNACDSPEQEQTIPPVHTRPVSNPFIGPVIPRNFIPEKIQSDENGASQMECNIEAGEKPESISFDDLISNYESSIQTYKTNNTESSIQTYKTNNTDESSIQTYKTNNTDARQTAPQPPSKRTMKLSKPKLKKTTNSIFSKHPNNYLKGCKWSPDGLALVTASVDKIVRIFNVPDITSTAEQTPSATHALANVVYDFVWNPAVNHLGNTNCNMLVTCKDNPVHLVDSFTGETRASYTAFSQVETLLSAFSVCYLSPELIVGGYCKHVRVFHIDRPGRESSELRVGDLAHQNNNSIVSSIVPHPSMTNVFAAGCYNTTLAFYTTQVQGPIMTFSGPEHGITQLLFSSDGTKLYAGCRMEPDIYCFDTRYTGATLHTYTRDIHTNQRIQFDIDPTQRILVSGNHDGNVTLYDVNSGMKSGDQYPANQSTVYRSGDQYPANEDVRCVSFCGHEDTVNGVSFHPHWGLLATASGRRHFNVGGRERQENSLKIWAFQ